MNNREYNITLAVRSKQNGVFGNTAVSFNETSTKGLVNLHGHIIAEIDFSRKEIKLFNKGWQSNTTKSRLNCTLDGLGCKFKVAQRNRKWYILNEDLSIFKEFTEGMVLSFA